MINLNEISWCVQAGKAWETSELVGRALDDKYSVESILKEGLMAGMAEVERQYGKNNHCLPGMVIALRAVNMGLRVLRTSSEIPGSEFWGTVIIGTVRDDIYDVEKNLMAVMMEAMGLRVIDLGVSVSTERFVDAAKAGDAQLIVCSSSRIGTMAHMKGLVQAAEAADLRRRIKILITGQPVTEQYRAAIGADFYAPDTNSAAETAAAHCRRILLPAA